MVQVGNSQGVNVLPPAGALHAHDPFAMDVRNYRTMKPGEGAPTPQFTVVLGTAAVAWSVGKCIAATAVAAC